MRQALAAFAAAAIVGAGLCTGASAAPVTILDEGYSAFDGYGPPAGGTWAAVSRDTSTASSGSASMKIDNHLPQEPYIQCRVALDTALSPSAIDPASAAMSFDYKLVMDAGGPANKSLTFGLQWGDWGYLSGYILSGSADMVADGAWHTATINFAGWTTAPAANASIDWMTITGGWSTDVMTANFDHFTFTSPVPEPATLSVLGIGSLLALRRRRA